MNRRLIYGLLLSAMVGVYLVMLLWSLPRLRLMAGGLEPFDLRPAGYSLAEAQALLTALGDEGRAFYLGVQHWLDTAFPALLASVLFWTFRALVPGWHGLVLGGLAAVPGPGLDVLENARVAVLLRAGPEAITADQVAAASAASLGKSFAVTLALVALTGALAAWVWRHRGGERPA